MDLSNQLGATAGTSVQCLTLYIPNKDQNGREIGNQRSWVLEGANLLAKIGGGVTITPPVEGGWLDENKGVIVWENPVLMYTFIKPDKFREMLPELREFLHRLGSQTNQGEVAFEFDGRFYRINNFEEK
ncbi:hypothetical protein [Luteolibacter sp. Populi]|uniref:hypothetical protein n=1 Tax=Luteolibacter sp. Populi TaxID=3230487 RepID=UPI0034659DA3